MNLIIKKGTQSKRLSIFVQDSSVTTGAGLAGLAWDTANLVWYYWREDEGNADATQVTLVTATRGTFTSGGFKEKDATNMPGAYEIGVPNAVLITGAEWVRMRLFGATNMKPVDILIQLVTNEEVDTYTRIGSPAGATVSVDVAAVKTDTAAIKTPTDKLNFDASNNVKSVQQYPTGAVVADGNNGTSQFKTNLTEAAADYYKDCWFQFTNNTLIKEVKKCTSYDGTNKIVRVSNPYTGTPQPADTFKIINE